MPTKYRGQDLQKTIERVKRTPLVDLVLVNDDDFEAFVRTQGGRFMQALQLVYARRQGGNYSDAIMRKGTTAC